MFFDLVNKAKEKMKEKNIGYFGLVMIVCFSAVLLYQCFMTIYINLFEMGSHLGYDSSWSILKARLIWEEKAFFSKNWAEQTGTYLDSVILLAALLYGIIGDVLIAYGLANIVVLVLMGLCICSILKHLNVGMIGILGALNIFLCPFSLNYGYVSDLGYASTILTGPAFYSVRLLLFLFIIKNLFDICKKNKFTILSYISLPLCVLTGLSVGFFLIMILIIPCFIYLALEVFRKNKFRVLISKEAIYIYACMLCVFIGKVLVNKVLGLTLIDDNRTWTTLGNVFGNFFSVIQGLLKLMAALPLGGMVIGKDSIYYIFALFIFLVSIISVFYVLIKCIKNFKDIDSRVLFLPVVFFANVILLSLFNVTYGAPVFEERYLLGAFFSLLLMTGYFISNLKIELAFTKAVLVGLSISLLFVDVFSNKIFLESNNKNLGMEEILSVVETTESELVYVYYQNWDITLTMGRALRVIDPDRVYKSFDGTSFHHWGDYLYYETNADYNGQTLFVVAKHYNVSEDVLSKFQLYSETEGYYIYICQTNPIVVE